MSDSPPAQAGFPPRKKFSVGASPRESRDGGYRLAVAVGVLDAEVAALRHESGARSRAANARLASYRIELQRLGAPSSFELLQFLPLLTPRGPRHEQRLRDREVVERGDVRVLRHRQV